MYIKVNTKKAVIFSSGRGSVNFQKIKKNIWWPPFPSLFSEFLFMPPPFGKIYVDDPAYDKKAKNNINYIFVFLAKLIGFRPIHYIECE